MDREKKVAKRGRDTIEQRAEEYSRYSKKLRERIYGFRERGRWFEGPNSFQRKVVLVPEPRNPLWRREDLVPWQSLEPLEERFRTLVRRWKKEVEFESSLSEIFVNHNYLKIIGLGAPAVPLILEELQREPDLWFLALESITEEDPAASEENTGNFKRISEIWLEWGRARGLI